MTNRKEECKMCGAGHVTGVSCWDCGQKTGDRVVAIVVCRRCGFMTPVSARPGQEDSPKVTCRVCHAEYVFHVSFGGDGEVIIQAASPVPIVEKGKGCLYDCGNPLTCECPGQPVS